MLAGYAGNPNYDCIHMMRRLAGAGWFVASFDYRGHGRSEGARGRHRPLEQAQDAHDALSWMQSAPGICKSITTTVGRNSRTTRRNCSASVVAHVSKPSAAAASTMNSHKSGWSSTTSKRLVESSNTHLPIEQASYAEREIFRAIRL